MTVQVQDKGLRALRFVVIAMGIALIGGMLLLFNVIYKRYEEEQAIKQGALCPSKEVEADVPGVIVSFKREGTHVTLLSDQGRQQALYIVHLCSGEVLHKMKF